MVPPHEWEPRDCPNAVRINEINKRWQDKFEQQETVFELAITQQEERAKARYEELAKRVDKNFEKLDDISKQLEDIKKIHTTIEHIGSGLRWMVGIGGSAVALFSVMM